MHLSRKTISRLLFSVACAALALLISCGGNSSNSTSTNTTSKIKKRLFLLNAAGPSSLGLSSFIYIINADNDLVYQTPIQFQSFPQGGFNLMAESPDKKITAVYSSTVDGVFLIDNATEKGTTSITLGGPTETLVVMSDNKTGVAAVRNLAVTNKPNGAVLLLDLSGTTSTTTISVPEARRVAINHAGTKVLAFADDTDSVYLIDATAKTATPIPGFDRPVGAVFSADDSKAYILNCGAECGGTTASVTVLNTSDNSLGANVPVNGATVGLLDSGKLYVAGSPNNVGQLDVIDTASMTRTANGIAIANGYHHLMAMADGGKLYIGAHDCSISNGAGCLSIFATSGQTAVIPVTRSPGNVVGIQPLLGRNLAYVTVGGEVFAFDTTKDAPRENSQLDVVGSAGDVRLID